jgi:hypothetical protein
MTAVDLGVDTDDVGDIGRLHEDLVEDLLASVVELIGEHPSLETDFIVQILSDKVVQSTGEPPDAWIATAAVPFL